MTDETRKPEIGEAIDYVTETGDQVEALVTAVHSVNCVNLVHTSTDPDKTDVHGRQLERLSSVSRESPGKTAHGRYFNQRPTE